MHRTSLPTNGTGASSASATSALTSNGVTRDEDSKMREKLAALEDLNELLEEPVEEQVRFTFCNVRKLLREPIGLRFFGFVFHGLKMSSFGKSENCFALRELGYA